MVIQKSWALVFSKLVAVMVLLLLVQTKRASAELIPGLSAEFRGSGSVDRLVAERPALFVAAGAIPTPMLSPGEFTVTWEGFLSSDLRADYLLKIEFSGKAELEINGRAVLSGAGIDQVLITQKPVRLNKGTNGLLLRFASVRTGDSYLRMLWGEKEFLLQPIPPSVLTHSSSAEESRSRDLHRGRDLFADLRCVRCHRDTGLQGGMIELAMDAPALDGIGSRRTFDWMQRWIASPQSVRTHARMPQLFLGPDAEERSRAVAAYLSSLVLKTAESPDLATVAAPIAQGPAADAPALAPLYERLQCAACHTLEKDAGPAGDLISLADVSGKFPAGELEKYLLKPEAHDRWSRMPNFHLSKVEAGELASFLRGASKSSDVKPDPVKPEWIARGRELVVTSGCLNCHALPLANNYSAPALGSLKQKEWNRGCLSTNASDRGRAPAHALSADDRRSLREFGHTDLSSLSRDSVVDFAQRQSLHLRCVACHGPVLGIPTFEVLGGKLQPEWAAAFIGGEVPYKPRGERHPKGEIWMPARMPAFPAYAAGLARGLALSHGVSSRTSIEEKPDLELAQLGRKLLGKDGGFSCVSCHAVGKVPALEVFESEGINLAYSGRRLQRRYFDRWMRSPISIDPQTKMPAYFDEDGQSQLGEILDGQAVKQIQAIWQYLRLGDAMEPPVLPASNP